MSNEQKTVFETAPVTPTPAPRTGYPEAEVAWYVCASLGAIAVLCGGWGLSVNARLQDQLTQAGDLDAKRVQVIQELAAENAKLSAPVAVPTPLTIGFSPIKQIRGAYDPVVEIRRSSAGKAYGVTRKGNTVPL